MNLAVFVICSGIGYVLGLFLPQGPWSAYVSILVSYHLYLAWMVFRAEEKAGLSLPVGQTVFTHLAFLMAVVGIAYARHHIPFFGLVRIFVPALAPFESMWLFSGSGKKDRAPVTAADPAAAMADAEEAILSATGEDQEAWMQYLRARDPRSRRPGMSIKEEYGQWMVARVKARDTASSSNKPA